MFNKHFFKILLVFMGIIALALIGIFWTGRMEGSVGSATSATTTNGDVAH